MRGIRDEATVVVDSALNCSCACVCCVAGSTASKQHLGNATCPACYEPGVAMTGVRAFFSPQRILAHDQHLTTSCIIKPGQPVCPGYEAGVGLGVTCSGRAEAPDTMAPTVLVKGLIKTAAGAEPLAVPVQPGVTTVADVKAVIVQHIQQDLTLFCKGKKVKSSQLIDKLGLRPGDFLTWIPKAPQGGTPAVSNITAASRTTPPAVPPAAVVPNTTAAAAPQASHTQPQEAGIAQQPTPSTHPGSTHPGSTTAATGTTAPQPRSRHWSSALLDDTRDLTGQLGCVKPLVEEYYQSGGFESLSGGHGVPAVGQTKQLGSPPDSPRLDTLLPGYISRPHPSPAKPLAPPRLVHRPASLNKQQVGGLPLLTPAAPRLCEADVGQAQGKEAALVTGGSFHRGSTGAGNAQVLNELLEELQEAAPRLQSESAPGAHNHPVVAPGLPAAVTTQAAAPRGMVIDLTCEDGDGDDSPRAGTTVNGAGLVTAGSTGRATQPSRQEVSSRQYEASLCSLPLPPAFESLYQLACVTVHVHRMLVARHLQPTYRVLAAAVKGMVGPGDLQLEMRHLLLLSQLVPAVFWLKDRTRLQAESDLGSARLVPGHTPHTSAADASAQGAAEPPTGEDLLCLSDVGAGWDIEGKAGLFRRLAQQGWPSHVADRVAKKSHVLLPGSAAGQGGPRLDVGGAVFLGDEDAVIVEITDPGPWKPPSVSGGHVTKSGSRQPHNVAGGGGQEGPDTVTVRQAHGALGKNVKDRCCSAVRRSLVQVVMHIHQLWATGKLMSGADTGSSSANSTGSPSSAAAATGSAAQQAGGAHQHDTTLQQDKSQIRLPPASALQWDVVQQRAWHPAFVSQCLYCIELEDVSAVIEDQRSGGPNQASLVNGHVGPAAAQPRDQNPFTAGAPRVPRLLKRDHACTSCETLDIHQLLEHLKSLGWYQNQVVHVQHVAARPAQYAVPQQQLSQQVTSALKARGVEQLYCHQAMAIDALMSGQDVVVATSTASGKSVCYNVPFMEALAADPEACAIYVFPTKALAQDQLRAVRELMAAAFGPSAPSVQVYDGDTEQHARAEIRAGAQLIITNPDMLHRSILPFHSSFQRLLSKLTLVVLDEGHAYHGVFGAHTAMVMRRLRRLCDQVYHSQPRFCVTSATIANPVQHACRLIGCDNLTLVTQDGSPTGPKQFVLWNPPLVSQPSAQDPNKDAKTEKKRAKAAQVQAVTARKLRKLTHGGGGAGGGAGAGAGGGGGGVQEQQQQRSSEGGEEQVGAEVDHVGPSPLAVSLQQQQQQHELQVDDHEDDDDGAVVDPGAQAHVSQPNRSHGTRAARAAARQALKEANAARRRLTKVSDGLDAWMADAGLSRAAGPLKHQLWGNTYGAPLSPTAAVAPHGIASTDQQQRSGGGTDGTGPVGLHRGAGGGGGDGGAVGTQLNPHHVKQEQQADVPRASARQQRLIAQALPAVSAVSSVSLPTIQHAVTTQQLGGSDGGEAHELDVRPCLSLSSGWSIDKALGAQAQPVRVKRKAGDSNGVLSHGGGNGSAGGAVGSRVAAGGDGDGGGGGGSGGSGGGAAEQHRVALRMPGLGQWNAKPLFGAADAPVTGTPEDNRRDSPIVELSLLLAECMQHGLSTIAFCKSRKLAELVGAYTRETLKVTAPHVADRLKVYRGGYSPAERRDIEQGLHNGQILGVAATNALELGVDIGGLDVTLHLGFQGSLASLRQQAGRAGRREQASLAVYVAFDGPLDQYFMTHPGQLFEKPLDHTQVNPYNCHVLQQHVMCAAFEWPVDVEEGGRDAPYFGPSLQSVAQTLLDAHLLSKHEGFSRSIPPVRYAGPKDVPAADVSLRTIDEAHVDIVLEGSRQVLEQVEMNTAFFQVYDGGIYLYQGRPYLCKRLDLSSRTAIVRPVDVKYYTRVSDYQDIHVIGTTRAYCPADTGTSHLIHPPTRAHVPPPPPPPPSSSSVTSATVPSAAASQPGAAASQPGATASQSQPTALPVRGAHDSSTTAATAQAATVSARQGTPACCGGHTSPGTAPTTEAATIPPNTPSMPTITASCEDAVVTVRFLGYHRIWQGSGQVFDTVNLWLPDVKFETQAAYIRLPRVARQACEAAGLPFRDGVHAASHAVLNVLPLLVTCDKKDMGTECDNPYDTRYRPERLILFDKHPGGIGLAAQAAPLFQELLVRALQLVEGCPCTLDKGCPACVQHPHCKNYNAVLSKQAGLLVLRACLQGLDIQGADKPVVAT